MDELETPPPGIVARTMSAVKDRLGRPSTGPDTIRTLETKEFGSPSLIGDRVRTVDSDMVGHYGGAIRSLTNLGVGEYRCDIGTSTHEERDGKQVPVTRIRVGIQGGYNPDPGPQHSNPATERMRIQLDAVDRYAGVLKDFRADPANQGRDVLAGHRHIEELIKQDADVWSLLTKQL